MKAITAHSFSKRMRILITSYHFYPEITPRAFRTYELAKEFARQGHEITVHIPDNEFDYKKMERAYNIKIVKVKPGSFLNRDWDGPLLLRKLLRKTFLKRYFDDRPTEFMITLAKSLMARNEPYDVIISIGLPFSVHIGSAAALYLKRGLARVRIADYGDPYTYNQDVAGEPKRWHHWLEKFILRAFDYITVPIDSAVESYIKFKDASRIKVIPQGICFEDFRIAEYKRNPVPTFVYGGIFYSRIRNPKCFWDFLAALENEFKFILYTDTANPENMSIIKPVKEKLGSRLEVRQFIPRPDFIREASKADFLVNIRNKSMVQLPSKIIDYALTGRPIFSCGQDDFPPSIFREFLRGEYRGRLDVDIHEYDIKNVCKKFTHLTG